MPLLALKGHHNENATRCRLCQVTRLETDGEIMSGKKHQRAQSSTVCITLCITHPFH